MLSALKLCKLFRPRSGPTKCLLVFLKDISLKYLDMSYYIYRETYLTSLHAGYFFMLLSSADTLIFFFNFFKKIFKEHYHTITECQLLNGLNPDQDGCFVQCMS